MSAVVDVDSHVYEPQALWDRFVPSEYQAAARAALWHGVDDRGNRTTIRNGRQTTQTGHSKIVREAVWRPGTTPDEIGALDPDEPAPLNPGAWDPEARLADMDAMGVDQALLFPTVFNEHLPLVENPDAAAVLARAYNDWALDHASAAPDRLFPAAVLPVQSLLFAQRELDRVAALGVRGVVLRPMFYEVPVSERVGRSAATSSSMFFSHDSPRGTYVSHPHFAPLWRQIEQLGLVACVHPALGITNPEATSAGSFLERVSARMEIGHTVAEPVAALQDNGIFLTAACFQGLMEDHPALRFVLLHSGATWLPLALEKAETYLWVSIPTVFAAPPDPVSLEPAEVFDEHPALVGFDGWETSVGRLHDVFARNAAWGSRYPHHDAAGPSEAIEMLRAGGAPDATVDRLMGTNAAELFRLPVVERVGRP
ncbi:MAG TPA: amidohydrolase family protein [Acidimicrobiia bacterium]|nr:amidohydrolase family protein [Acidimicrobiia bacterium]